jgi:hypothetical protein
MESDSVLNMRVPTQVKKALSRAADEHLRSMSSMAVWVLSEWLNENGYLSKRGRAGVSAKAKPARARRK